MAETTKSIVATPHDTNQTIVSENNGTINIHNHLKQNDEIKALREYVTHSFSNMERFFHENQISVKKKRKR